MVLILLEMWYFTESLFQRFTDYWYPAYQVSTFHFSSLSNNRSCRPFPHHHNPRFSTPTNPSRDRSRFRLWQKGGSRSPRTISHLPWFRTFASTSSSSFSVLD